MGYKDEPDFNNEGKPILRRTTPLHLMTRGDLPKTHADNHTARDLFNVYDRFDVNYIDEFGLTHFHVACRYGCEDVVEKFLELGQDPNLLVLKINDSPLLLALNWRHKQVAELLLRRGADPNLPNVNGLTPLHVTCQTNDGGDLMKFFFNINDKLNHQVQVNFQDKFGNTPLHFAVHYDDEETVKFLLRRGADPNRRNAVRSTPLHLICHSQNNDDLARLFFKMNEELNQLVQVNAADNYGRTPLQLAVFYLRLDIIDLLIKKGADLSSFVFPTDIYCGQKIEPPEHRRRINYKLRLASGVVLIVERLKKSGYGLDRGNILTIMNLIAKHGLFEKSAFVERRLFVDVELATEAKKLMEEGSRREIYKAWTFRTHRYLSSNAHTSATAGTGRTCSRLLYIHIHTTYTCSRRCGGGGG
uniref:Uncharacterized protein n=1 Tax=Trichogramma kaykai TaxID=54128 RepID=A0ABD2WJZ3_9HYME